MSMLQLFTLLLLLLLHLLLCSFAFLSVWLLIRASRIEKTVVVVVMVGKEYKWPIREWEGHCHWSYIICHQWALSFPRHLSCPVARVLRKIFLISWLILQQDTHLNNLQICLLSIDSTRRLTLLLPSQPSSSLSAVNSILSVHCGTRLAFLQYPFLNIHRHTIIIIIVVGPSFHFAFCK